MTDMVVTSVVELDPATGVTKSDIRLAYLDNGKAAIAILTAEQAREIGRELIEAADQLHLLEVQAASEHAGRLRREGRLS